MGEQRQFYMLKPFNLIQLENNDSKFPSDWLGRIVIDHSNPEQSLPYDKSTVISTNQYRRKPFSDVKFKVKSAFSSKPHMDAVLLHYEHQSTEESTAEFAPLAVDQFRVIDEESLRQRILGDAATLQHLRKLLKIGGKPVWVIVGFLACANRTVPLLTKGLETIMIESSKTSGTSVPASAIAASSGVAIPLPSQLDLTLGEEKREVHEIEFEYSIEWPCIFAIEYRSLSRMFRMGGFRTKLGPGPQGSRTFTQQQTTDNNADTENSEDVSKELFWGDEPISDFLQDQGSDQLILQEFGKFSFVTEGNSS